MTEPGARRRPAASSWRPAPAVPGARGERPAQGVRRPRRGRRRVASPCRPARSLAIVGESGSGKTTIARMIVGLERPTAGTITACGRDRSGPARSARVRRRRGGEVQIVFQDPYTSLDPRQTAEATIDEVLRLHHGLTAEPPPEPDRRADRPGRPGRAAGQGAAAGAVRRPAAAGRDRAGAGRRAAGADPGRVGRRARRVDPGPGAEPAGRHPRLDGRLLRADQP